MSLQEMLVEPIINSMKEHIMNQEDQERTLLELVRSALNDIADDRHIFGVEQFHTDSLRKLARRAFTDGIVQRT